MSARGAPHLAAVALIAAAALAGCADEHSDPLGTRSTDTVEDSDFAGTMEDELEFAGTPHTCPELEAWYSANPGDSNVVIANQYYARCGETPPPVKSGELSTADIPALVASIEPCPSLEDMNLEVTNPRLKKSFDLGELWVFDITGRSRIDSTVYVWADVLFDWEGGKALEENFLVAFEVRQSDTGGYIWKTESFEVGEGDSNFELVNWVVTDNPKLGQASENYRVCSPNSAKNHVSQFDADNM